MRRLSWKASYELGAPLIDDQHRDLLDRVNAVLDATVAGASVDSVIGLVDDLLATFEAHWRHEEDLFADGRSPYLADQRAVHAAMGIELARIRRRFADPGHDSLTKAARTLRVWVETRLIAHIIDDAKACNYPPSGGGGERKAAE